MNTRYQYAEATNELRRFEEQEAPNHVYTSRIPVSGSHNWKDGQDVEEGRDFEIKQIPADVMIRVFDSAPRKLWESTAPFAFPIVPAPIQDSGEDLKRWQELEAWANERFDQPRAYQGSIQTIKHILGHFTLTPKS